MKLDFKEPRDSPGSSAFFFADTEIHRSHLHRKSQHLAVMEIPCWSNWGDYCTRSAESRPLHVIESRYPEEPPAHKNLLGMYSSRVTSVGFVSVCLAFSRQAGLCKQAHKIHYNTQSLCNKCESSPVWKPHHSPYSRCEYVSLCVGTSGSG